MSSVLLTRTIRSRNFFAGIIIGVAAGTCGIFGALPAAVAGFAILLLCFAAYSRSMYNHFVLLDIFLLSVVMIEPAPSDIVFCILVITGILGNKIKLTKGKHQSFIFIIFLIYFTVSILGIAKASDSLHAAKYYAITLYLFLFSVFIFLYTSRINITLIVKAYVYSCLFAAILGLAGYIGFFSKWLVADSYRVNGLFKDPNVFGPFIVPAIILLLDALLYSKKLIVKSSLINVILILTGIAAVVLSFSRAAWINLMVAATVYYLLNIDIRRMAKTLVYLAVIAAIAFSAWFYTGDSGFKNFIRNRAKVQEYDKDRFASQRAGLYLAAENPTGYGPGQYELEASKLTKMRISAHSLYMRLLMEDGVAGFILFFTGVLCIIARLFAVQRDRDKQSNLKCSVLISILAGILVNSLVVDTLHWRHLWFFIGLSLFKISEEQRSLEGGTGNL